MRAVITAAMMLAAGTGSASANGWSYQQGPEEGRHAAFVCAEGQGAKAGERLCFGLSCSADQPMRFGLSAEGDADLLARPDLDAQVFAGVRVMPPLAYVSSGLGTFDAPMTEGHLAGIEGLKNGSRMELRYWESVDAPPTVWQLSLTGSRNALTELETACPMPDFAAQEKADRTMADPAAKVLADMREACAALGGEVTVGAGYATQIDLDGSDPADLVLRHGALTCSTAEDLVCGPAGCLTTIWQAGAGGFTRVFMNAVQDVSEAAPGTVTLTLKGSLCGRVGAPACTQLWELQGDTLAPLSDQPE